MKTKQILRNNSLFAGYTITAKLSTRHDGEREVYRGVDAMGEDAVVTVYDLGATRYASKSAGHRLKAEDITEVRFFREQEDMKYVAPFLGCGVSRHGRRRLAWMAQKFMPGVTLDEEIRSRKIIDLAYAKLIIHNVAGVAEAAARFTNGGGHYNISTDNILVNYDGETLTDVRVIGFANMGESCNGTVPFDTESIDARFRAKETLTGIFSYRSDIYSLGMVFLTMVMGHPELSEDYNTAIWQKANRDASNIIRLVMRKATDESPMKRFSSIARFKEFVDRIGTKDSKTNCPPRRQEDALQLADNPGLEEHCEINQKQGFDAIAGMEDLKALFRRDFIRILQNPHIADAYNIKPSNGILLYGPMGCGKTMVAECAAVEAGLNYKVVKPSDLGSIYIHGSQQKIAETFQEAEQNAPMILIFDEFDALVPKRNDEISEHQAGEINELLTRLNNCASRGVYVLATSNRPDHLDPAILRTGRIDRFIYVGLPDFEARKELLKLRLGNRPKTEDIDLDKLAEVTDNYTCSDIAYIVDEAARRCFEETLDKGLIAPLPISMKKILDVARSTRSSVSDTQRKEFQELRAKMDNKQEAPERKKVGFAITK